MGRCCSVFPSHLRPEKICVFDISTSVENKVCCHKPPELLPLTLEVFGEPNVLQEATATSDRRRGSSTVERPEESESYLTRFLTVTV